MFIDPQGEVGHICVRPFSMINTIRTRRGVRCMMYIQYILSTICVCINVCDVCGVRHMYIHIYVCVCVNVVDIYICLPMESHAGSKVWTQKYG